MVKRYFPFPYVALFGAVTFVIASLFFTSPVPAATESQRDFHSVITSADDFNSFVMHVSPIAIASMEVDEFTPWHQAIRTVQPLAPEYAESLKTDALNFIETRMRC
jgi:hypothetical protein